jgi:hypothetical protein
MLTRLSKTIEFVDALSNDLRQGIVLPDIHGDATRTGTGGNIRVCEACKRPIAKPRREAVPWTRLCRDCKEREHPDWNPMHGLGNGRYWWARDAGWY